MSRRTVLVTGASGGIGRGIALACGAVGWRVWIAARRPDEAGAVAAEVTAAGGEGRALECDVGDETSVRTTLATVVAAGDGLDGIVHNATSGLSARSTAVTDVTLADLEEHTRVATRGFYLLARHGYPHLAARGGSFVVMTSEAGIEGKRLFAPYAMVKAQQRGLVSVLAREWGPACVRVNAVAPLAATPGMDRAFADDPALEERVMGRIPLGRLGHVTDDIGAAVRFLLGDDSRFVTGETLMVDGGSCPT